MKTSRSLRALNRLALSIGCLASGAAWAQVTVVVAPPVVIQPAPTQPVASARQQEMAVQLARANLTQQGIKEPTTGQLALATSDVQALRDSGMGWGQIANSLGLRLGSVVSAANKADKEDKADKADRRAALDAGASGNARHRPTARGLVAARPTAAAAMAVVKVLATEATKAAPVGVAVTLATEAGTAAAKAAGTVVGMAEETGEEKAVAMATVVANADLLALSRAACQPGC